MGANVPVRRSAARPNLSSQRRVSLCETLDRVLNKGAVVYGDVIISVAGVDLLYLGLNLIVTSVETMRHWEEAGPRPVGQARGLLAGSPGIAPAPRAAPAVAREPEVRT